MPDFVAAILRHDNAILMVKHQGADDPEPFWSLAGGKVEAGETGHEALIREVKEETGLDVLEIGALAYHVHVNFEGRDTEAEIYEVTRWQGSFDIQDPDNLVLEAAFIPLEQAIIELAKIDYLPMSEPPVGYLRDEKALGTVWRYRHAAGFSELLED